MSLAARIIIHPVKTRRISHPRLRTIDSPEFNRYFTGFASVLRHGVVVRKNYLYPSRGPLFEPVVVRQNKIGGLSMANSHINGIEERDPKQGGQKDLPLASALAGIWWIRKFEEVGQTPIGMSFLNDGGTTLSQAQGLIRQLVVHIRGADLPLLEVRPQCQVSVAEWPCGQAHPSPARNGFGIDGNT